MVFFFISFGASALAFIMIRKYFFFSYCSVMRLSRWCARFDNNAHCLQQCRQLALQRRSFAIGLFCVRAVTEQLTLLLHHWTMTITTVMMMVVVEIKC